jgi:hypothetical protein
MITTTILVIIIKRANTEMNQRRNMQGCPKYHQKNWENNFQRISEKSLRTSDFRKCLKSLCFVFTSIFHFWHHSDEKLTLWFHLFIFKTQTIHYIKISASKYNQNCLKTRSYTLKHPGFYISKLTVIFSFISLLLYYLMMKRIWWKLYAVSIFTFWDLRNQF